MKKSIPILLSHLLLYLPLSHASYDYTITFHETSAPILAQFSKIVQVCLIRDNQCCIPIDLETEYTHKRRPFFASHATITRASDTTGVVHADPTHTFDVHEPPNVWCRGPPAERLSQPSSAGVEVRTTGQYDWDGISDVTFGVIRQGWGPSDPVVFPQRVYLEDVLYEPTPNQYHFMYKKSGDMRPDLPSEIIGKPYDTFHSVSRGNGSQSSGINDA